MMFLNRKYNHPVSLIHSGGGKFSLSDLESNGMSDSQIAGHDLPELIQGKPHYFKSIQFQLL